LPLADDELGRITGTGMAVVLVDAQHAGLPAVVTDDTAGGRIATEHLLQLGHRRIAFIGDDPDNPFGFSSSARRENGYRAAMADAGAPIDETLIAHGPHERGVGTELAGRLL